MQSNSNNIKMRADDFSALAALIKALTIVNTISYKKLSEKKKDRI